MMSIAILISGEQRFMRAGNAWLDKTLRNNKAILVDTFVHLWDADHEDISNIYDTSNIVTTDYNNEITPFRTYIQQYNFKHIEYNDILNPDTVNELLFQGTNKQIQRGEYVWGQFLGYHMLGKHFDVSAYDMVIVMKPQTIINNTDILVNLLPYIDKICSEKEVIFVPAMRNINGSNHINDHIMVTSPEVWERFSSNILPMLRKLSTTEKYYLTTIKLYNHVAATHQLYNLIGAKLGISFNAINDISANKIQTESIQLDIEDTAEIANFTFNDLKNASGKVNTKKLLKAKSIAKIRLDISNRTKKKLLDVFTDKSKMIEYIDVFDDIDNTITTFTCMTLAEIFDYIGEDKYKYVNNFFEHAIHMVFGDTYGEFLLNNNSNGDDMSQQYILASTLYHITQLMQVTKFDVPVSILIDKNNKKHVHPGRTRLLLSDFYKHKVDVMVTSHNGRRYAGKSLIYSSYVPAIPLTFYTDKFQNASIYDSAEMTGYFKDIRSPMNVDDWIDDDTTISIKWNGTKLTVGSKLLASCSGENNWRMHRI